MSIVHSCVSTHDVKRVIGGAPRNGSSRHTVSEALAALRERPPRGEFTIVLEGAGEHAAEREGKADPGDRMRALLEAGAPPADAVQDVMRTAGISRREAYDLMLRVRGKR